MLKLYGLPLFVEATDFQPLPVELLATPNVFPSVDFLKYNLGVNTVESVPTPASIILATNVRLETTCVFFKVVYVIIGGAPSPPFS